MVTENTHENRKRLALRSTGFAQARPFSTLVISIPVSKSQPGRVMVKGRKALMEDNGYPIRSRRL